MSWTQQKLDVTLFDAEGKSIRPTIAPSEYGADDDGTNRSIDWNESELDTDPQNVT